MLVFTEKRVYEKQKQEFNNISILSEIMVTGHMWPWSQERDQNKSITFVFVFFRKFLKDSEVSHNSYHTMKIKSCLRNLNVVGFRFCKKQDMNMDALIGVSSIFGENAVSSMLLQNRSYI